MYLCLLFEMTDTMYYYCRFCAERLAARLVVDFGSHPSIREDVQNKLSVFQHSFIDLDLKILPQSICKSCYETLNRAFLFANNVRKSQTVLVELYLDNVGSDDDDNEASLSKLCPSVDNPLCTNAAITERNTSAIFEKETFSNHEDKSVGAEANKESSSKEATSLGRHETGKEPNMNSEVVNSTVTEKDTSHDNELITIIEFKEETTDFEYDIVKETELSQNKKSLECKEEINENYEEIDKIANTDSIDDSGTIVKVTASSHIQELLLLDCKEETADNDYEDTEAVDPLDSTVDDYPIIKETLPQHGQDTYESQKELSADNIYGDINETALSQRQELLECKEQIQQKKKTKKENNGNVYEVRKRKYQIDSTTDRDPILKETIPLHDRETECQEALYPNDTIDKASVSVISWDTNLYDCKFCVCDTKFSDINSLREHCKSLHQVCNGFRCRECSMELADFNTFISHHREHRPELEGFCQFCNMELNSAGAGHVGSHGDLFCKFCGEVFTSASGFKEHYLLYAPEAMNNRRSHCVHGGHDLGNDETPHRDFLSDACVACGEHFREQTLQQQHSTREKDTFLSTDAPNNIDEKNVSLCIEILKNEKNCLVWKYFECDHCHKQFKLKSTLRRHMGVHYDVYSFYCKFCDAKFKQRSNWIRHLKSDKHARAAAGEVVVASSVKLDKYFECDHCQKRFKKKRHLEDHLLVHYDVFSFKCGNCDKKFKLRSSYRRHLRNCHNPSATQFKCNHCHKQYKRELYLKRHMVIHNDVYSFYCKLCDAKFMRLYNLNSHLKSKHAGASSCETSSVTLDNYFECDHCHKRFKKKRHLKNHLVVHYNVSPFKCGHCDKQFKLRSSYRRHLRLFHILATQYECYHCHKTYKYKSSLRKHEVSHNRVYTYRRVRKSHKPSATQFECDFCRKQYKNKSYLRRHMVSHYEVYQFYCKLCDAKFKQRRYWLEHLNSNKHATVAAGSTSSLTFQYFECDHCHKQFKFKTVLRRHMAGHYDVYPFHCKFCDAKFKRLCHWKQHLKSDKHARAAGETQTSSVTLGKYFECDHCHRQCKSKSILKSHMASHYDVYPFCCKICDKKFKRSGHLHLHLKTRKHARAAARETSIRRKIGTKHWSDPGYRNGNVGNI